MTIYDPPPPPPHDSGPPEPDTVPGSDPSPGRARAVAFARWEADRLIQTHPTIREWCARRIAMSQDRDPFCGF